MSSRSRQKSRARGGKLRSKSTEARKAKTYSDDEDSSTALQKNGSPIHAKTGTSLKYTNNKTRRYKSYYDKFPLSIVKWGVNTVMDNDARSYLITTLAVCLLDALFQFVFIRFISYTDIDWTTYMEQIRLIVEENKYDYYDIEGPTGPLVYPAGFVYIYSALYYITDHGVNVLKAQIIFGALHVLTVFLVGFYIFQAMRTPAILTVILLFSKRLQSIYTLRLFNDPWATLFVLITCITLTKRKYLLASICFSLGLSVKMNVAMFAPGMALLYWNECGLYGRSSPPTKTSSRSNLVGNSKSYKAQSSLIYAGVVIIVQVALAAPFIIKGDWFQYVDRSFDLRRQFMYKWTVNWKFVTEKVFLSSSFSQTLAISYLFGILAVAYVVVQYSRLSTIGGYGVSAFVKRGLTRRPLTNSVHNISESSHQADYAKSVFLILSTMNCMGIICARSLHYQFWSWYAFFVPGIVYLGTNALILNLFHDRITDNQVRSASIVAALIGFIELDCLWCVYPARAISSLCLLVANTGLFVLSIVAIAYRTL